MEVLQLLKFIIKQGRNLDFTDGTSREAEINWLESLMDEQNAVPEDMTSFIASLPALADE
ncbi:hypothetical protein DFH06DRAFT_1009776 [Mycena polygramma]|nr:hypothetical protein DFH06DRAFT_1009776 [Mycena polygramma]